MIPAPEHPSDAVCAASKCTRPPAGGSQLCASDTDRLGQWLAQLGTEYERLSAAPSMQGREVGTVGGTGLTSQRAPGNTHVMAMRSRHRGTGRVGWEDADAWGLDDTPSVFETLATYAALVREGRGLAGPRIDIAYVRQARPAGPVCDPERPPCRHHTCQVWTFRANVAAPLTVATERRLLAAHLDWILAQDWAGEFFDEIRRLWGALRRANGHAAPKTGIRCRLNVGGQECGGRVRLVDGTAVCQGCGTAASGPELLRIAAEGAVA